ncbi:hypothetical protein I547_0119 [Mycobacterium kansasii 824]|nr:hypothetical protein I547_0119 [Mycobacterium kansasii 824]
MVVVAVLMLVDVHSPVIVSVKPAHFQHLSRDIERRHQKFIAA